MPAHDDAPPAAPAATAALLLSLAESRPPTLGTGRLVCIDGPAGSGKTTLAAAVAALRPGTPVVHMDDLYEGWSGLPHVAAQLAGLLEPLGCGEPGRYRRYDWHRSTWAETVVVPPGPLLVVEGVGSGDRTVARLTTVLAWVSAPPDLRLRRGLDRDGESMAPAWERWMRDEAEHLAREQTEARADVLVDGTGVRPAAIARG